jgi:phosphoserine aminotransferase
MNSDIDTIAPTTRMHNFNGGPSILPATVIEAAAQAVRNFNDTGLSILEIGHRTKIFEAVMEEARSLVKELMQLDDDYEVLFLHGGATTQFMQVPMNLLNEGETAAYTDTGVWASKALKEARDYGNVNVICSSKDKNYNYLPQNFEIPANAKYLHLTTNNTIYGTQWHNFEAFYNSGIPLVADMSSDILSRRLDFKKYVLIYGGAQKNMGAAGVNLVVINKNILGKVTRKIPTILDYRNHIEAGSMLNTPPVFAVYVAMCTLRWIKESGGVATFEAINNKKAALLYDTLDTLPIFQPTVEKNSRSKMNVCFLASTPELEKKFLALCDQSGIYGVRGHRSVGGFRASLYNALPLESVQYLTGLMTEFAQKKG